MIVMKVNLGLLDEHNERGSILKLILDWDLFQKYYIAFNCFLIPPNVAPGVTTNYKTYLDISDAFDAAAPKIPTNEDLLFFL